MGASRQEGRRSKADGLHEKRDITINGITMILMNYWPEAH